MSEKKEIKRLRKYANKLTRYALFSLNSLYILLRWLYDIDYPETFQRKNNI